MFPVLNGKVFCPMGDNCPQFLTGDSYKLNVFEHVVDEHNYEQARKWGFNYDLINAFVKQCREAKA